MKTQAKGGRHTKEAHTCLHELADQHEGIVLEARAIKLHMEEQACGASCAYGRQGAESRGLTFVSYRCLLRHASAPHTMHDPP